MPLLKVEVAYASFYDEKLPPGNIAQPQTASFTATTGGFPHEIVLHTVSSFANVSRILCRFHDAKRVIVERQRPDDGTYMVLVDSELERRKEATEVQELNISLDPEENGKSIHEIRVKILSGYTEFVGIFPVDIIGEESIQKLAVLESQEVVDM